MFYSFFPACMRYSINKCFVECIHRHFGGPKLGFYLECRNFLRLRFSELAALQKHLCIFDTFFVGFRQIVRNSLLVFSFWPRCFPLLRCVCSSANMTIACTSSRICPFAVNVEYYFFYFPFLRFAILYPVASFATISVSSFLFISWWEISSGNSCLSS